MESERQLVNEVHIQAEQCRDCKLCVRECMFLQQYGSPKEIAERLDLSQPDQLKMAFECSLCGLCGAVCPAAIEPAEMFLAMRREAVRLKGVDLSSYSTILGYEKVGTSSLFSYSFLPKQCSTVLFPGCTFTGTRPGIVKQLFSLIREQEPNLGLVLDCCAKPSHDLGLHTRFEDHFSNLCEKLIAQGIQSILVLCPSCHRIFSKYGRGLKVRTVYEELVAIDAKGFVTNEEKVVVHDPCTLRMDVKSQTAVRQQAQDCGVHLTEMEHRGAKTLCCGEGGAVGSVRPDLAFFWRDRRKEEAGDRQVATSCAGCVNYLGRQNSFHILDLFFARESLQKAKKKVSSGPKTYLNRLLLKFWFTRKMDS